MDPVVRHYAKTSFDVSDVLYQCSRGEPIFKIIKSTGALDEQLDQILDAADPDKLLPRVNETIGQVQEMIEKTLNETVESFGIDGITKPIVEALDNADLDGVFANVSSTINVTDIKTQLSAANLTDVAKALREAETKARAAGQAATADKLRDSAAGFEKLETDRSLERDVIPILDVINAAVERLLGKKSLGTFRFVSDYFRVGFFKQLDSRMMHLNVSLSLVRNNLATQLNHSLKGPSQPLKGSTQS